MAEKSIGIKVSNDFYIELKKFLVKYDFKLKEYILKLIKDDMAKRNERSF